MKKINVRKVIDSISPILNKNPPPSVDFGEEQGGGGFLIIRPEIFQNLVDFGPFSPCKIAF